MDIASIVGMLLGVVMFVFGVLSNGGVASLHSMWDTASFIITIGGSIAGTLASFKLADFINGIKSIKLIFKDEVQDPAVVTETGVAVKLRISVCASVVAMSV